MKSYLMKSFILLSFLIANVFLTLPAFADDPGFAPCPFAATESAPSNSVVVIILSVETTEDIDTDIWPFTDRADVYGNVSIKGETFY